MHKTITCGYQFFQGQVHDMNFVLNFNYISYSLKPEAGNHLHENESWMDVSAVGSCPLLIGWTILQAVFWLFLGG